MNEKDIKNLWQNTNQQLEKAISINQKNTEEITKMKAQNLISAMKPMKIFTLLVGIIWVLGIGGFLATLFFNAFERVSLYFFFAALLQIIITAIAIVVYVYQLFLIEKIDFSEPVFKIQKHLSKLKISTLNVTRVLFLQLPLWTIFYISNTIINNNNVLLIVFQCIITLLSASVAIWLFVNIKYENRNQRWFKLIFVGKEWDNILYSMDLLTQIEDEM